MREPQRPGQSEPLTRIKHLKIKLIVSLDSHNNTKQIGGKFHYSAPETRLNTHFGTTWKTGSQTPGLNRTTGSLGYKMANQFAVKVFKD